MGGLETWFVAKLLGLLTSNIVGNRIYEQAECDRLPLRFELLA